MFSIKTLFTRLFGADSRPSTLESMILDCVRRCLDTRIAALWDMQVQAINRVQRLPEGVEVDFYRMKNGRPSFDESFAFPNRANELMFATARIDMAGMKSLTARLWCIKGFLFSIEYDGSVGYFEEAADMDPRPEFRIECELVAELG